jgi:hypothetical protein
MECTRLVLTLLGWEPVKFCESSQSDDFLAYCDFQPTLSRDRSQKIDLKLLAPSSIVAVETIHHFEHLSKHLKNRWVLAFYRPRKDGRLPYLPIEDSCTERDIVRGILAVSQECGIKFQQRAKFIESGAVDEDILDLLPQVV